ncbi:hypothetical protein M1L60_13345 [Actinoplanes sp. TRM 88003]|uniref:Uncharacterized protein n=1 Tax=Paractinoplanes aksuensis TaxID=2939490 RepID=A0ABT1DL67_9ACTN|nr:hypothetical protein [Actinoplanes aksuensis]MCO8271579.1 hypothetical protein [Actinoplanes aksuensis]
MRDEFQKIEWAEPPMGDLVSDAVSQGRRMRTARRLRVSGAGLAVLVVAGLAATFVVRSAAAPAPAAVVAAAPAPSVSSAAPATGSPRVKGTPAGLLKLLVDNLPDGKTSQYAGVVEGGDVSVQTFLDRGQGPGMIRLHVMTRTMSELTGERSALRGTWIPLGNGAEYQTISVPGNCVQQTIVYVRHADDTLLQFDLYGCPELGGKKMRPALTAREAAEVGADPRWGVKIDPALNKQGAAAFPHLPTEFDK